MLTTSIGTRFPIQVSRIGLGCVTFGREIDEKQSFRLLDYAVENGINLLDTAEAYGGGQAEAYRADRGLPAGVAASSEMSSSEKIIGRWLRSTGMRRQVVLQTKVTRTFTRPHLQEALTASLERLGVDAIDIYMFHSFDPASPLQQAMEAMAAAVDSGRVRIAGCSNFSAAQLAQAQAFAEAGGMPRLEVIQPPYNLVRREIEQDTLPWCHRNGVAAITYSPLGAGFLSGKYDPAVSLPAGSRFDVITGHTGEYFSDRNFRTLEQLREISQRTGLPMVRLAMSWVLQQPSIAGVLIGARNRGHIDNALLSLSSPLPPALMGELDGISRPDASA